jgi:hypothetical protein
MEVANFGLRNTFYYIIEVIFVGLVCILISSAEE